MIMEGRMRPGFRNLCVAAFDATAAALIDISS